MSAITICSDFGAQAVDESGGENKVGCCKEQYCIGTWNVRSMNQSKWEVVKQEIGEGNGNPLQYSCLKSPMNSMKRQRVIYIISINMYVYSQGYGFSCGHEWM